MAGLRRKKELPLAHLGKKHIHAFCSALKEKLRDKGSNFGKEYLKLLVDEIRVDKKKCACLAAMLLGRRTYYVNKTGPFSNGAQFCPCMAPHRGRT